MSRHNEMPPVPPANRSHKGTGDHAEINKDTSRGHGDIQNFAEQGDTANIKVGDAKSSLVNFQCQPENASIFFNGARNFPTRERVLVEIGTRERKLGRSDRNGF